MSHELETPPAHLMQGTVWRHKKRGSRYTVIFASRMQSVIPDVDEKLVVSYQCHNTRNIYTRAYDEFTDGRFERIS